MNLITTRLLTTIVKASTELPGLHYTDVRTALVAYRDYFRSLLNDEEPQAFELRPRADALLDRLETTLDEYAKTHNLDPDFNAYHQAFKLALRDVNRYNGNRKAYLPELPERLNELVPDPTPEMITESGEADSEIAPAEPDRGVEVEAVPTKQPATKGKSARKPRPKAAVPKSPSRQADVHPLRAKPLPRKTSSLQARPKPAALPVTREVYLLHVSLVGSEPEVWRRLMVTTDTTLAQLHRLLQLLMDLNDDHLHRFKVGYDYFGPDSPDGSMDLRELYNGKTLHDIYAAGYKKFFYTYDFAANREHRLTIQQVLPYEKGIDYPLCTNGAHAAPPDNSVTTPKYNNLLVALADKHHADHELARELLGRDWEVDYFSASEVNEVVRQRFLVVG